MINTLTKFPTVFISAAALFFLPISGSSDTFVDELIGVTTSYAKNGNNGNNGNGGNSGNSDRGGGKSSGKSARSNGKSGNGNRAQVKGSSVAKSSKGKSRRNNANSPSFVKRILNKPSKFFKKQSNRKTFAFRNPTKKLHSNKRLRSNAKSRTVSAAASAPIPAVRPNAKKRNFNAKLAGLNSLNRNYHAYMNSNDPRMQKMREFIESSLAHESAYAAAAENQKLLDKAKASYEELTTGLSSYDDFSYDGKTPEELVERYEALSGIDPNTLTEEEAAELAAEIDALDGAINSDQTKTYTDLAEKVEQEQLALAELSGSADDEALKEALLAAANDNRVAEYGEENYVDQEMLDWAKDLLGVGDAYGKIDEIREAGAIQESAAVDELRLTTQ